MFRVNRLTTLKEIFSCKLESDIALYKECNPRSRLLDVEIEDRAAHNRHFTETLLFRPDNPCNSEGL